MCGNFIGKWYSSYEVGNGFIYDHVLIVQPDKEADARRLK